ncbi:MAG TPA: condensation domain-containing protein [Pseudonocardiaceae bacterium]
MTSTLARIMVDFTGGGTGEGELSWGQKENWHRIVKQRIWAPLGGVNPLPPDTTTTDDVAAIVRYLMSRHQSLRTRLRLDDDGHPTQIVSGSGTIPMDVVDTVDADPATVAESVAERYLNTPMDFTTEWPLRVAVIRDHGRPTHTVTMVSHLATDAAGIIVMMGELATRTSTPIDGMPPLAQAAWQRSPAGRRHNDAAMRYWEGILRTIEPDRFRPPPQEHSPRYWHGEFNSPALLPAVRAIAETTGLGTSTVVLALFAVALTDVTGINPVVVRPIVGNRFRPGLADVVCTVAQAGLCVLDVAGVPFGEALRRVQRSVINAYKYAYYDHDDMIALRTRIERERGTTLDTGCFINDRHDVRTPNQTLAAPNEFRWLEGQDSAPLEPLFVAIDDIQSAIKVTLHMDTRSISLADAEAFARGMAKAAVASR